jgi:hypothetical protein
MWNEIMIYSLNEYFMFYYYNSIIFFFKLINKYSGRLERKFLISGHQTLLSKQDYRILERNRIFKNCHKGDRCFIIGNGPSLKNQDLSYLKDELTFVMNAFFKHPINLIWEPTYYFLADPIYFDGSEPMKHFFKELQLKNENTKLFVPLSARGSIEQENLSLSDNIQYVAFDAHLMQGLSTVPDLTKRIPYVQSVSQFAIMAAMFMGCNPIYLLGLDHDWLAHRGQDQHFYDGKTIENHPKADGDLSKFSYKYNLEAVLRLWEGYEIIKQIADKQDIRINNATNGGFLDVFPEIDYYSLFS